MSKSSSSYAQSAGLRLLQTAVQELGPMFTREQVKPLANAQGLSNGHLSKLLSLLRAAGQIEILKRGVYIVRSPLFGGEVHPFAIAMALVNPSAISHWSALAHHGFTTQFPTVVQASTTSKIVTPEMRIGKAINPRGRAVWKTRGVDVEFIHVQKKRFFGFQQIWVDNWHKVNITDPERTALDLIARPDLFGGMQASIEILEANHTHLDLEHLVDYTLQYDVGAIIKRVGWVLDRLGVDTQSLVRLQAYPASNIYRLDPHSPASKTVNRQWQINENLMEMHHA